MKFIYRFLFLIACLSLNGQNLITVPFTNGFVGDNTGNNRSSNSYYLSGTSGLGWTNVQFAQNSTSNIFVSQGNDIIGMVLITDNNGVEHVINGFVKWRAPSGTVTTICFQPGTGTNVSLATNGFNGLASYTINDTKYIGLTFNGSTLSISPVPGTVTGNAATNGLLDALNTYLATFGKLSVADISVLENAGTATVTVSLSASSTNSITVAYTLSNGTATAGVDYSLISGTLTFAPGQTSRTFTIPIIDDTLVESSETINVTLSDPTNASILDANAVVTIIDNDTCILSSPTASVTVQPTCSVTTGTIVFTTQSGVEYSIDGTTYQSSATFTGVAAGTYTISVRSTTDTTCITTGATVTVNAAPSAPSTPVASVTVQPTCAVTTGTIVFTTQSGVEYSIDGTTYQSSATFTGVAAGTYTISVRSTTDTTCITTGATVTVNAAPSAPSTPVASVTVQPTCAVTTGTIVFTTQSGVEYSIDGTTYQSSATFTGVAPGTYTISVRSTTDNTCSTTGATVTVNAAPSAPSTPVASVTVQPTCSVPTGTIVFTTQSAVEYSIDGTNYQSSATFTGVAAGTYTISVRSTTDNTCTATGATVTVNAAPSAPSTPTASVTVQPTCSVPTGTIVFTTQSAVEYSIDGTNYQSSATFTGVAAGTYTISVRSTTDTTCITTGATVTVNAAPSAPSTPVASVTVQPTCAVTTGTIVFTTQSAVEYSIDGTNYQSSATFTGVAAGTYTISVRSTTDTTCITTGATVTVNAAPSAPSTPVASVTVQPTCAVTTGTIVFTTQSAVEYSIDGTNYQSSATFTGVAAGTYTISVRSTTDNTCSTTGATVTVNAAPSAPSTPTASVTVQPTCAVTTGTIVFTTQSGVEYSIDGTNYQSSATFTGVAAGTYTISVRSTTDNTCSTTGATVTVNAVPSAPSTPVASVTVQPTCAVTTGTIVFTTQSGVEYSIDGTNYQSSATFTGVAAGTYTISVRSTTDNTCSTTGATVTVNAAPSAPSTPVASVTVQPTCAVTTGTIVFTTQSGVEYSIDGTNYQSSATFTGVAAGTYTISVRSTTDNTCSTTGATVTVNAAPSAPSTPVASVTVQPTCAVTTGTIVFTTQSAVEYSIDGTNYQSSATFTGVAPGTYTISVRSTTDNTCSTTGASVTVNNSLCAVADTYGPINGYTGATTASVLTNDTLNGVVVNPSEITLTGVTVPTGFTLNADGTITIASGTPAGTYTVTYSICEVLNPTNCDTATSTITVTAAAIDAVADTYGPINGYTGATTASVLTNDTLNGVVVNPSEITLTGVTVPTGFTLNADGTITIASGTPAGTYTVTYSICEVLNPTNCDTATSTITVTAAAIDAVADTYGSINGYTGATTASVLTNDTLNGVVVNPSEITLTGVTVPTGFTLNADGTITIASGTPAGTYTVTYSICEVLNPTNCDTATSTITVTAAAIDAVADTYGSINGYTGATTASVLTNDTLNGVVVNPSEITLTGVTVPTGFTLNADGTITIASGTPAGTYTVTYSICEVLNPTNCDTATSTITVTAAAIDAVADTYGSINGYTGATTASVLTNDTLNGVVVNPSEITLTGVTVPTGFTLNADGTITIASGTPAGTYTVTYSICEVLNPTNCDTATSTITVTAAAIDAVADTYGPINGYTGATTASVLTNDTLNGVVVNPSEITLTGVTVPTGFTLNADGTITIASGTPAGTYTVTYSICEVLNPTNCDTATSTITVTAAAIDAVADTYGSINGYTGATTASVLTNDTLNGVVVNPSEITLTGVTVPTGFTLNADGTITIASGTPAGTYTVTYSICEVLNPTNCDTATSTITVTAAAIDAVADTYGPINGYTGATTASVLTNDTLNGVVVNPSEITLTGVTVPTGFTLNADGTITIASGTPAGTYTVTYSICEVLNPTNCDTATSTITVTAAAIDAVADTYGSINGYTGATTASVLTNDTLNGVVVNPSEITLTGVTVPTGFTLNADGTITIASGTPAGTYTVTYSICEVLNPTNCDTATSTITVTAAAIDAVADTYGPINGYTGATTASVLTNDTLNGVVVNPSEITLTGVTVPTGFTLNADGTITIASGTPAGTYTVTYSICEVLNPTNCDTADAVVTVVPPVINAVNDDYSGTLFNGVVGGIAGDITLNDTLNGTSVLDSEITISLLDNDGITGLSIDANGNIFIPAGTAAGSYSIQYQICEILNPTNCDVATVTIIIGSCLDFPINDCDGDGVTNGQEALDGTDPSNSCDLVAANQDTTPNLSWLNEDCDGDGVTNGQEVLDGTDPIDSCDYLINHVQLSQGGLWLDVDCDGDGVTNGQEVIDGTDPLNPCESIEENVTLPQSHEFLDGDCDGDGLTNGEEIGNNPNSPNDANGNGIPDYLEINNYSTSDDDLEIFNLVTPNDDGDNDVFVIRNIELYPNNSVEIYNRWGVLVFETNGYGQNQKYFRGISEGRVTINQDSELPVGTYFYIVKYVNSQGKQKERSGYLYINR